MPYSAGVGFDLYIIWQKFYQPLHEIVRVFFLEFYFLAPV